MSENFKILKEILEKHFTVSKKSNERSSEIIIKCPYCGDKTDDLHRLTGHYHMYINAETGQFHCFLCNASGSVNKLVRDFKSSFDVSDLITLSSIYSFPSDNIISQSSTITTPENYKKNYDFENYIKNVLFKFSNMSDKNITNFLLNRISISGHDNLQYLKYLTDNKVIFALKKIKFTEKYMYRNVNKSIYSIIQNNNTFAIPENPYFNGIQLYLPIHTNLPKYINFKIDKDVNTYNYIGNYHNPKQIYIVEGIFDALKLYNILSMNKDVGIVVLAGKTKVNNVITFLSSLKININFVTYYFGLDSDVEYDEYLGLIKQFKQDYSIDFTKINVLVWNTSYNVKDLGEIVSVDQYNDVIKIVPYYIYSLKKIYDAVFKEETKWYITV